MLKTDCIYLNMLKTDCIYLNMLKTDYIYLNILKTEKILQSWWQKNSRRAWNKIKSRSRQKFPLLKFAGW